MPERKIISQNIKKYRMINKLSQFEMAEECGISIETLSLLERERTNVTLDVLQKIAAYTGYTVADILTPQVNLVNERILIMNVTYQTIKENFTNEDNVKYSSWSIEAIFSDDEHITVVDKVPDVFLDFENANTFVNMCNMQKLSLCHLRDAIQDFIEDN